MTNYKISCNFREVRMLGKRCITMKCSSIHITGPELKKKLQVNSKSTFGKLWTTSPGTELLMRAYQNHITSTPPCN